MKKLSGFSLMEMMVVLLIISIVAAATAPMINRRYMQEIAQGGDCLWSQVDDGISYNDNNSVMIGTNDVPDDAGNTKLHIETNNAENPHITFGVRNNNALMRLFAGNGDIRFTGVAQNPENPEGVVLLGNNATTVGGSSVTLGAGANTAFAEAIAIGHNARCDINEGPEEASASHSIAIGAGARASNFGTIAIGRGVVAGQDSVCIGTNPGNPYPNSSRTVAIGSKHMNNGNDVVVIGNEAQAHQNYTMSIGSKAYAVTESAIAIGYRANANAGIAIGSADPEGNSDGVPAEARGTGSIAIGTGAEARDNGIAIGKILNSQKTFAHMSSIAIGRGTNAEGQTSIAIGGGAETRDSYGIAIGSHAQATDDECIAIGRMAIANGYQSMAIGNYATNIGDAVYQIVIGGKPNPVEAPNTYHNVYIPGDLVVAGNVILGANRDSQVLFRESTKNQDLIRFGYAESNDEGVMRATKEGTIQIGNESYTYNRSDRRLKNVGKAFTAGLEQIKKLEVFNYTFKSDKSKTPRVGVMAQDLQKIFPDAVVKGDDGFLRIRMEDMFYALVNAVKELDNKIEKMIEDFKNTEILNLTNRVCSLEKENKELHKTINALEKRLEKLEKLEK